MKLIAAVLVALAVAAAAEEVEYTINLYGAPAGMLASENPKTRATLGKHAIVAFKKPLASEMTGFVVPEGIESIFDGANVGLQPLRDFLANDVPLAALTLGAAHYLDLPEMDMPLRRLVRPASNLETAFHLEQDAEAYPFILFLAMDDIHPRNHMSSIGQLTRLGELAYSRNYAEIIDEVTPDTAAGAEVETLSKDEPVIIE